MKHSLSPSPLSFFASAESSCRDFMGLAFSFKRKDVGKSGKCLNYDFRVIDRINMIIANHKNQVRHLRIIVLTKGGKQKEIVNDKKCIFAP